MVLLMFQRKIVKQRIPLKIDLEATENGKVKFDFDGKRYIYYNCLVESIVELEQRKVGDYYDIRRKV